MILEMDIRKALFELMITKWPRPEYQYYLREVHEAYRMPCFFILADLEEEVPSGVACFKKTYQCKIMYYEKGHKETKTAEIVDGMRQLFLSSGKTSRYFILHVKDRYLEIKNFSYNYVGSDLDVPEIVFRLEFVDSYAQKDTHEIMEDVHTETIINNTKIKEV